MPQKYTLEYLKKNKVAVNCRTKLEIDKVQTILSKPFGWMTDGKDKIVHGDIIYFNEGDIWWWDLANDLPDGFEILPASEFLQDWEDESKETPIADIIVKGDGEFEFIDHTNAATIAAIRTHLNKIDNLLKQIK